jgi:hypothetical protein
MQKYAGPCVGPPGIFSSVSFIFLFISCLPAVRCAPLTSSKEMLQVATLLLYAAVVAVAGVSSASGLQLPIKDVPYVEFVSHRLTYRGVAAVDGWGQLPFNVVKQVGSRDDCV